MSSLLRTSWAWKRRGAGAMETAYDDGSDALDGKQKLLSIVLWSHLIIITFQSFP
jgi:hypothetical protein